MVRSNVAAVLDWYAKTGAALEVREGAKLASTMLRRARDRSDTNRRYKIASSCCSLKRMQIGNPMSKKKKKKPKKAQEPAATNAVPAEPVPADRADDGPIYESNEKHREPWQRGARGSICEKEVRPKAKELLEKSIPHEAMRYAVFNGRAYCAKEHSPNRWHGHPVGWVEVPPKLRMQFCNNGDVSKREIDKYWEGQS